jgi:hypothetical protein
MTLISAETTPTFQPMTAPPAETYVREGRCSATRGTRSAQIRDLEVVVRLRGCDGIYVVTGVDSWASQVFKCRLVEDTSRSLFCMRKEARLQAAAQAAAVTRWW